MKVRAIYNPREKIPESDSYEKPFYVFVINGKGDWGNGEWWDDGECEIAMSLKAAFKKVFGYEPITEGDVVWVFKREDYESIGEWKEDVMDVYREWKNDFKRQERSGK